MNDITTIGVYYTDGVDTVSNKPISTAYNNLIEIERQQSNSTRLIQRFWSFNDKRLWIRQKSELGWADWKEISFDIPSFYKNYADLSSLANALGEYQGIKNIQTYELQYGVPVSIYTGYSIVFIRHRFHRSMAILFAGSGSGVSVAYESHVSPSVGFYVGSEERANGIRVTNSGTTSITVTSFVDSTTDNILQVSYIQFGS